MAQNTARGTPAKVLLLFALLSGVVVAAAWRDALRRDELEHITWPTALGDTAFYQPGALPLPLAIHGGVFRLEEVPGENLTRRDDAMFRVPLAVPEPRLYTISEFWVPGEVPPLFMKTGRGEYMKVTLRQAESP